MNQAAKNQWVHGKFEVNLTSTAKHDGQSSEKEGIVWLDGNSDPLFGICQRFLFLDDYKDQRVWFDLVHIPTMHLLTKTQDFNKAFYAAPNLAKLHWKNIEIVNGLLEADYAFKNEVERILSDDQSEENRLAFHGIIKNKSEENLKHILRSRPKLSFAKFLQKQFFKQTSFT